MDSKNTKSSITYKINCQSIIPDCYGVLLSGERADVYSHELPEWIKEKISDCGDGILLCCVDGENEEKMSLHSLPEDSVSAYHFFFVECDEDKSIFAIMQASPKAKLWINYRLYTVVQPNDNKLLEIKLKKGINTFIVESCELKKDGSFFLRLSDFEYESIADNTPRLMNGAFNYKGNNGYVVHSGNRLSAGQSFVFAFYPNNDRLAFEKTAHLTVENKYTGEIYEDRDIEVCRKQSLGTSGWEYEDADTGNCLRVTIEYKYDNGAQTKAVLPVCLYPIDTGVRELCRQAKEIMKMPSCDEYSRLALSFGVSRIDKASQITEGVRAQTSLMQINMNTVKSGKSVAESMYMAGIKRVFFFNRMYNAVNFYRVCVPKDYDKNKKYPLLIINSTFEYGDVSRHFLSYTNEPLVVADISGRGVLLGSYIGEAAINAAIEDLLCRFSIDEDRIYCTGSSNGGGATWAQAEIYPHRYAGAYIVSGHANLDMLPNLKNMQVIFMSSPTDYLYPHAFCPIREKVEGYDNFLPVTVENYCHNSLSRVWISSVNIDLLLSQRRNKYPNTIEYTTFCNRHRRAYWIEIDSIESNEKAGFIKADISGGNILISCDGITSFTLELPPQIDPSYFKACINGESCFEYRDFSGTRLHYEKTHSGAFAESSEMPFIDMHRGSGLLDVYLVPMTVLIPQSCSEAQRKVAAAYSEPYCNGFIPKVFIDYPIAAYDELYLAEDHCERSYVVIDDLSDNGNLKLFRENAHISVDREGWTYQGEVHSGRCCVMQIMNSPLNPSYSILLISCNDEKMLQRNIFTRKVIIPSYVNGRHQFWNNDALIFDESGYHAISDYGKAPADVR